MAKYLLTGVAGFIAHSVCKELLRDGHTVIGVDNLNSAYDVRLKRFRLAELHGRIEFHELDITDRPALERLFAAHRFDAIINLAARAGVQPSVENPWVYLDCNATGTLNLLELARVHGVPKLVLASTSSLYGNATRMPICEGDATDTPLSPYAASKKAAEAMCYTYHHLHHIDVSIVRYFTVYGPAGRPDMSLFRFVQRIMEERTVTVTGDGSQSRDFSYVEDIARGTVAALAPMGFQIINLGSDSPHKLIDMLHLIEDMAGKKARIDFQPVHPADVRATWADVSKAKRLLGWTPTVEAKEGLARLVQWYREQRDWARDVTTS